MLKLCFITFGCKLNQAESLTWQEKFGYRGIQLVGEQQKPDLIIINACAVTAKAERELRQTINRTKRINSRAKIVITGCYLVKNEAPRSNLRGIKRNPPKPPVLPRPSSPAGRQGFGGLSAPLSSQQTAKYSATEGKLVDYSVSREKLSGLILKLVGKTKKTPLFSASPMRTRALVKIQDGCDNFCAYCIVPFLRGRLKSKSVKSIIKETQRRESQGYQEIVLVGADLQKFGNKKQDLAYLLKQILKETKIPRIRLSSLWPTAINQALIDLIKSNPRPCPHLHLSMQSGSDKILRQMGRRYAVKEVLRLVKKMRAIPNLSLTADLMVGFPGETDKDFKQTIKFVQAAKLLKIHIFKYSLRPGTRAAKMTHQISEATKRQRSQDLAKIGCEVSEMVRQKYLNKTTQVLVEHKKDRLWTGLTSNYLRVYLKSQRKLRNQLVLARLIRLWRDGFYGKII